MKNRGENFARRPHAQKLQLTHNRLLSTFSEYLNCFYMKLFIFLSLVFALLNAQENCNSASCSTNQTCCLNGNGTSTCCKYANAVCCGLDSPLCCPENHVCDPVANQCIPPDNSPICDACTKVIALANSSGCSLLCTKLPVQMALVCEVIQKLGICQDIISWIINGETPYQICGWLHIPNKKGFCYSGTCPCGYCTESFYDRCLSLPNHCPSKAVHHQPLNALLPKNSNSQSSLLYKKNIKNKKVGICLDGKCQASKEGCCLTCL